MPPSHGLITRWALMSFSKNPKTSQEDSSHKKFVNSFLISQRLKITKAPMLFWNTLANGSGRCKISKRKIRFEPKHPPNYWKSSPIHENSSWHLSPVFDIEENQPGTPLTELDRGDVHSIRAKTHIDALEWGLLTQFPHTLERPTYNIRVLQDLWFNPRV